jgi:hypothetical protein
MRLLKRGSPIKKPPKPSAAEREQFCKALEHIPVGKKLNPEHWNEYYAVPYLRRKFVLWGVELAIYPLQRRQLDGMELCTGTLIISLSKDEHGNQRSLDLRNHAKAHWYGSVIRWLDETFYT